MTGETCGCCATGPELPLLADNRPALASVRFRIGTFSSFRASLLRRLVRTRDLAALRTRASDDPAIALLELWAVVADVLTFYQERIANESLLRTATLRESITRLVRLIDYDLRPGLAATARLAFTLENVESMDVPAGLRVQSVPGPHEKPQKFATDEPLEARLALNQVQVFGELEKDEPFREGSDGGILASDGKTLAIGGDLLLLDDKHVERKTIVAVEPVGGLLRLRWTPPVVLAFDSDEMRVAPVRRTMRLFGHNAPVTYMVLLEDPVVPGQFKSEIESLVNSDFALEQRNPIALDAVYEDFVPGTQVLVEDRAAQAVALAEVSGVTSGAERFPVSADAGVPPAIAGAATRITLRGSVSTGDLRQVVVHELIGAPIAFHGFRYPATISGSAVYVPLDVVSGVDTKRTIILDDNARSPVQTSVANATPDGDHLRITLAAPLSRSLDGASAVMYGNVAPASHGESVRPEVLGDTDAGIPFQRFFLSKQPVTFRAGAGGVESSVDLRVNDIRWTRVPTLYAQPAGAQVYVERLLDDGTLVVQFGDGEHGARPPSGVRNVVARYRQGAGLVGRVRAGTLTNLLDRPVGVRAVTNPLPAEGGADREELEEARHNAPTKVRTFDRAVSLLDLEDLATASGEIAKASAALVWDGDVQAVHLTVAAGGGTVPGSDVLARLVAALAASRDPNRGLHVAPYAPVPIVIGAALRVLPTHVAVKVAAEARAALLDALSFERLAFGQSINLSDVYAVLHEVAGVEAVDMQTLQFRGYETWTDAERGERRVSAAALQPRLRIFPARPRQPPARGAIPAEQARIENPATDLVLTTTGGLVE